MTAAPHLWRGFQEIATTLTRHGVPRPSDRWMAEVERFYSHPAALTWFACVGRGGGKNLVGILCDLTEVIFGDFVVPPGERHYQINVGENLEEAEKTLAQTARYLNMLGIPFAQSGGTLDLGGDLSDRGLKVLACRVGAVSGFRSLGATTQEGAKWNNQGTNPAEEVATSIAAQTVTHSRARQRHFSTPMGRIGFFYDGFATGNTAEQIVSQGPSWVFNTSLTEAHCWKLARGDKRIFRREYMAEPQAGAMSAFDPEAIDRAFTAKALLTPRRRAIIIDASSGRKDAWTWAVCGWNRNDAGEGYLSFDVIDGVEGAFWQQTSIDEITDGIAHLANELDIIEVHGDQREAFALAGHFERHGLTFTAHDWTAPSKMQAVERVRRWLAEDQLSLPEHAKLRSELHNFEEQITSTGAFRYGARGNGHDDYVALLLTAAMAELSGELLLPPIEYDPTYDEFLPRMRM